MNRITTIYLMLKENASLRWSRFSQRERRTVVSMGIALAILLAYFLLILPLAHWKHQEQKRLDLAHEDLIFTKKNIRSAQYALERQKSQVKSGDLTTLISNSARMAGISISRVQPAPNVMSLWINEAGYQQIIAWLVNLHNKTSLKVHQIRMEKIRDNPGMVKTFLKLGH